MDPLGWSPEQYTAAATWVAAGAAVATLAVLVFTARYAARQFEEAKKLRQDQNRPYVVPSIDVEQQMLFVFAVENVGRTPAFNVKIQFDDPPRSETKELEDLRMLREPIPTMPPDQRFRAYWESSLTVFNKEKAYPHPLSHRVTVSYEDHQGHVYGPESYVLDFRIYEGQAAGPKGITDLIKAVDRLVAEHKKWTDGTQGLNIHARNAVREQRRGDRPHHLRRTRLEYEKQGWRGAILYWIKLWRRRFALWS